MKKSSKLSMIALSVALLSGSAFAANDGPLAVNETSGDLLVSAEVQPVVSIKSVADIDFGLVSPGVNITKAGQMTLSDDICVYTNAASFELQLDSSEQGGDELYMTGSATNGLLRYTVALDETNYSDSGLYTSRIIDSAINGSSYQFDMNKDVDENCISQDTGLTENVGLTFTLSGSDVFNVEPDYYEDLLTVTARAVVASLPMPM
jgi:spore coat protein U-like protein